MKTSLSHLPEAKQDALKTVTEIVIARVPAEMIILFGSYARGEWVEDYQEYRSARKNSSEGATCF
jgi:uncharacterized protein